MKKTINIMASFVFVMALAGILIVASASEDGKVMEFSQILRSNAVRQVLWLGLSLAAGLLVLCVDYRVYKRHDFILFVYFVTLVALTLVFVPYIGYGAKGSRRWLNLQLFMVQPSEFAKLAVVALTCAWVDYAGTHMRRFKEGILYPGAAFALVAFLVAIEVDVGATMVMAVAFGAVLFVGGARPKHLLLVELVGFLAMAALVATNANRRVRVAAFVQAKYNVELVLPGMDREELAAQVKVIRDHAEQSTEALRNGGFFGRGYMYSEQKKGFLREAYTDFIAAIVGEEFGFFGECLLILGYVVIFVCGLLISRRAPDRFGQLLAFGMSFLLVFQAAVNLGVVTDFLPTTGITLPFMSYGGTSLLASMIAVGVILNVGHKAALAKLSDDANVYRDAVRI